MFYLPGHYISRTPIWPYKDGLGFWFVCTTGLIQPSSFDTSLNINILLIQLHQYWKLYSTTDRILSIFPVLTIEGTVNTFLIRSARFMPRWTLKDGNMKEMKGHWWGDQLLPLMDIIEQPVWGWRSEISDYGWKFKGSVRKQLMSAPPVGGIPDHPYKSWQTRGVRSQDGRRVCAGARGRDSDDGSDRLDVAFDFFFFSFP